jgi:DNA-binding beta-propeller fold protein YncE
MRNLSRFLAAFLTLLLFAAACTPAPTPRIASSQGKPTVVPSVMPAVPAPTATAVPVTYESSVPAVLWGENNKPHLLFPLDPSSGEALPGYEPIPLGRVYSYAFSLDRRTLAVITFPHDAPHHGSLLLVDLIAWESQRFELELEGWPGAMVFSPDGGRLAISNGDENTSRLTLFDLKEQAVVTDAETDLLYPRIKFTSAGDALMLYGLGSKDRLAEKALGDGTPQVLLLEAADLSPRWQARLEGVREGLFPKGEKTTLTPAQMMEEGQAEYLGPGVVFAPDRDALYVVHADSGQLTTADFEAQTVQTVEIHAGLSWFERLLSLTAGIAHAKVMDGTSKDVAVSPDGQFLYVIGTETTSSLDEQGNLQSNRTPLGLEIIRTGDGSRVAHIETGAGDLSLSPDGRFLYLRDWGSDLEGAPGTEVFDVSSRQIVTRKAGLYLSSAFRMNSEPLLVSTYSFSNSLHQMTVLQPDDLSVLAEWQGPGYIAWLAIE